MLYPEETLLIVIDFQEKLLAAIHNREALIKNAVKLIEGANILGVPILATEQNPEGLGSTVPEIAGALGDVEPVAKVSFSCMGETLFQDEFDQYEPEVVLICGIESHVCVYQSAFDLVDEVQEVQIVTDAVGSRTPENCHLGIERCRDIGCGATGVEMVLFDLLGKAEGPEFKQILNLVK
jgi:nicotinamidase-related amidase